MISLFFTRRRWLRHWSVLLLLLCEACSMKHETTKEEILRPIVPHIQYNIPKERIRSEELENGMRVLMYQDKTAPQVLMQIGYEVGSANEGPGERGLAHLLEHMVFKGTEKLKEGDIDAIARKYGASFNAFTSKDMTSYYFEVDKNNWKAFLSIMADCMKNVRLDKEHLASELHAVVQELKMYKDKYWRRMIEETSALLYPAHHPYHCPIIGYKEDLALMDAQRLRNFYEKYYHPEKATLLVMGDIEFDEVMETVKEQFGDIPYSKGEKPPLFPVLTPELTVNETTIYEVVQKKQLCLYWPIPGVKQVSVEMLSMISQALGGGEGSRLYKRLVDELQIADGVSVDPYLLLEAGTFLILIEPKDDTLDRCIEEVKRVMQDFIKQGITDEEMQKAIVSESSSFFKLLTDLQNLAYEWLVSLYATDDPQAVFTKIDALYGVQKTDVQLFAKKYLDPFLMSQMTLLPVPEDKKNIWQGAKEASDSVDKEILAHHVRTTAVEKPEFVDTIGDPNSLTFSFPKPSLVKDFDNGLQVITYERSTIPLAQASCIFKDTHRLSNILEGVAVECMMSLLIEGTKKYSKEQLVDFFEHAGADYHFSVGGSTIGGFTDGFEKITELFVHILKEPAFTQDALDKVKAQMIESYVRAQDSHVSVGRKALKNSLYAGHPYAWTFDDAIVLIKGLTIEDMQRLHAKYIRPDRMILCLAGDPGKAKFLDIAQKYFGSWNIEGSLDMILDSEEERKFLPAVRQDIPMLRDQAILLLGQPSTVTVFDQDYVPLKLLNFICFHSLGSRLYALREQTGLFYNASGAFASGADRQAGYDFALAIVNPENLEQTEVKIKEVLKTVQKDGVTQQELDAAKQLYLKGLINATVHVADIASMMSNVAALGLPFEYYDTVLERVQKSTVEEINRVAQKYADPSALMTVRVGRV